MPKASSNIQRGQVPPKVTAMRAPIPHMQLVAYTDYTVELTGTGQLKPGL